MFCAVVAMTPNPALDDSDHGQNSGSEIGSFHLAKGHIRPRPRTQGTTMQKILAIMAGAGCLLALLDMPSEYYKVLRFVVVAACIAQIIQVLRGDLSEAKRNALVIAFGLLAAVFNPIMPLYLESEQWAWFNLTGAALFAWSVDLPRWLGKIARRGSQKFKANKRDILTWAFVSSIVAFFAGMFVLASFSEPPKAKTSRYMQKMMDEQVLNFMRPIRNAPRRKRQKRDDTGKTQ
jgi:AcrR family transcriptional regulator